MAKMVFERREKKYLLTNAQYKELLRRIQPFVQEDEHGAYTLTNLYFDNDGFESIRRSIEKPTFKEKMRLRAYGTPDPDTPIYWELKKKCQGMGFKRRIVTTPREMERYLKEGIPPKEAGQIFRELEYALRRQALRPRIYLAYDRVAFYAKEDRETRITFDCNIRYRWDHLDLTLGDGGCVEYPLEGHLMELKVLGGMPLWLAEILSACKAKPISFSKYGKIYESEGKALCSAVFSHRE